MKIAENKIYLILIAIIVAMSGVSLFSDLMEPDGALYASIAKNMVLNGDWLNLYVHGSDWLDKPHLTFWMAAASFKVFGISAFAYKLPSFLISMLGAWYLYCLAHDIYNRKTALISVIIFLSSLHILISNFDVRAEGYITTFTLAAIYHYYKAQRYSFWHIVAGSFFAACAIMVKGIFVLIPVFAGFIIYWVLTHQYRELIKVKWWIAILLIMVFILPELYALRMQFDLHPEKVVFGQQQVSGIKFFFWDSQFGRFFNNGPIKGKGDVSFFLHTNLWAFLPWSFLFYTAMIRLFRQKNRVGIPKESLIIWASALTTFLLFSLSKFQLPHYIIIIFPQFAIITALYLIKLQGKALQVFFTVQNILFILVIVLLSALAFIFRFPYYYFSAAILLVLAGVAFICFTGRNRQTIVARGAVLSVGLMVFLYLFFYPSLLTYQSGMEAGKWLKENHPEANAKVLLYGNAFSFDFYANGGVKYLASYQELDKDRKEKNMVIYTPESELAKLKADYHAEVLKSFDYFHITKLKPKFLDYNKRPTVLEKFYLVRIH